MHAESRPAARMRQEQLWDDLVGREGWGDDRRRFVSTYDRSPLVWSYRWGKRSEAAV